VQLEKKLNIAIMDYGCSQKNTCALNFVWDETQVGASQMYYEVDIGDKIRERVDDERLRSLPLTITSLEIRCHAALPFRLVLEDLPPLVRSQTPGDTSLSVPVNFSSVQLKNEKLTPKFLIEKESDANRSVVVHYAKPLPVYMDSLKAYLLFQVPSPSAHMTLFATYTLGKVSAKKCKDSTMQKHTQGKKASKKLPKKKKHAGKKSSKTSYPKKTKKHLHKDVFSANDSQIDRLLSQFAH